jgi:ATP-dependent RNA helicase TDRD9
MEMTFIGIGNVPPEVYKAVKFRQIEGKLPLKVLSRDQTILWAVKHKLGRINQHGIFQIDNGYVKNPRFCVLPTMTTTKMEGVVTHVENGNKFFFHPTKGYHENLTSKDEVNWISYEKDDLTLQMLLKNAEISPVNDNNQLNEGDFVLVKKDEILRRAMVIDQLTRDSFKINLIDVGSVEIFKSDVIFTVDEFKECIEECKKEALMSYPPRVFECTLMQIRPSVIKSRDGKWTENAVKVLREKVVNSKATIEIYSVVDDIASVKLTIIDRENRMKVVNKKLVEIKHAEECEESYLSKLNHEHRQQIHPETKSTPEEEFAGKKKEQIAKLKRCPAPPKETCEYTVKLNGPFSPLETSLNGISRIIRTKVNIDQHSVNSVLLNDDILNFRSKFYVAANVTFSPVSNSIVLHDINTMPTIPGLAVLLALIFCPTAEFRRDEHNSRYVSLLTGLGFDKRRNQPFFGEHDCCLDIDFKLDEEDIEKINHLRFCLSVMLRADPGCNYPSLLDGEKVKNLEMIQTLVLDILNKQRPLRAADKPFDPFDWNVDQENVYKRTDPNGNEGIYTFLGLPRLQEMSDRDKAKLRLHVVQLVKCAKNTFTIHNQICRLCGFEWTTTQELTLHLLSTEHVNRLEELQQI